MCCFLETCSAESILLELFEKTQKSGGVGVSRDTATCYNDPVNTSVGVESNRMLRADKP